MTPNEIKKALECCMIKTPPFKCEECPLLRGTSNSCIYECKELAYNLINQYEAEIEDLDFAEHHLEKVLAEYERNVRELELKLKDARVEIDRLEKHNTEMARKHYQDGKVEAIKEFAERLKINVGRMPVYHFN